MKHAKRISALICVFAICFTLVCAPSAHAVGELGGQAAGAWIAAGLVALNIVADVAIGSIGNYFGWQGHPTKTALLEQDIQYTFPVASQYISDYMNAATIKVDQGVTTIDGVEYDELWIEPGTFTNGLKTNLFDFKTKWNILSGQSGITLASGDGYYRGVPIYKVGSQFKSQSYVVSGPGTFSIGNSDAQLVSGNGTNYTWCDFNSGSFHYPSGVLGPVNNFPVNFQISGGSYSSLYAFFQGKNGSIGRSAIGASFYNNDPFEYNYTSGIVPANESDIPSDYGLSVKIPHDQLQTFYNTYPQYNVDYSVINIQEEQIDIDELTQAIFDRIQSMEDIKVEWNEGPVEPEPEPEPPAPVEDVIEGLNVITQQQFEQMQQQTQIQQQQQQMQQQQLQEQQQIGQNTSEISEAIKDVTATPDAQQLPNFKFDLRELFPFCIPFDIYRLLSSFDAQPQAPHVQLPIVIDSIGFSYNLDLDFSAWDPVAQAMRTAELIVYAIGLAWATGKVIKW